MISSLLESKKLLKTWNFSLGMPSAYASCAVGTYPENAGVPSIREQGLIFKCLPTFKPSARECCETPNFPKISSISDHPGDEGLACRFA